MQRNFVSTVGLAYLALSSAVPALANSRITVEFDLSGSTTADRVDSLVWINSHGVATPNLAVRAADRIAAIRWNSLANPTAMSTAAAFISLLPDLRRNGRRSPPRPAHRKRQARIPASRLSAKRRRPTASAAGRPSRT
jgi:hypothetical protein